MIEIKSESSEMEEGHEEQVIVKDAEQEEIPKEEAKEEGDDLNNNEKVETVEVKKEDQEEIEEEEEEEGRDEEEGRVGGMSPMETATLLLLSRIAMFNKVNFSIHTLYFYPKGTGHFCIERVGSLTLEVKVMLNNIIWFTGSFLIVEKMPDPK